MALAISLPDTTEATSLNEVRKLLASDAEAGSVFGRSVAINGDTAIVGAASESASGGAAYILQRGEGGADNWGEVKKLTASDGEAADIFGGRVAVSGDIAVVGAHGEDAEGSNAGAAYLFQRDEGGADNWGEVTKLTASDAQPGDNFGISVAVSGDTAIVGAARADNGAAYVFQRDEGGAGNWGEVKKVIAVPASDFFGGSVAVAGDTAIVGASQENNATGTAYVFERDRGGSDNWGEAKKLLASDGQAADFFGGSVAVSGDSAVVGASFADGPATQTGAAYVFQRDEGGTDNWGELTKLTASDAQSGDFFGRVAVDGDTALVGAHTEDAGGDDAGAAYVFQRDEGGTDNWGELTKLTASDAQADDRFGISVAVAGDTAIVGALWEDAGGDLAGATYVFDLLLSKPPTATAPPAVGGIAGDVDLRALPVEVASPGSSAWGMAVGVALATLLAGGGAVWYARARKPTEN